METKINASWFSVFGYCEYRFYLEKVKHIEIPLSVEMRTGSEIHGHKEKVFLEQAIPASVEEFLDSTNYVITKEIFLLAKFENNILMGKIDEIAADKNGIYIIEDKPRARPFDGVKNQIFAYCYIFKRNFSERTSKPIYGILRDRDSNREVWKSSFNTFARNLLTLVSG